MKKKRNGDRPDPWGGLRKCCKVMRLTAILSFFLVFNVSAGMYAQKKVSLDMQQVSVLDVIKEIRTQTGVRFFFNHNELEKIDGISISVKEQELDQVLDALLKKVNLTHRVEQGVIVIVPSNEPQVRQIRIGGVVTDERKQPLPGVTVLVKGTTVGVSTDQDGKYSLGVPSMDKITLLFTFIGMQSVEVEYAGKDEINVVMKEERQEVEEVLVTGIFNRPKESFTGAVTVVTGEKLRQAGTRNMLQSLSNIDPSFRLMEDINVGSNPNALPNIVIRGATTIDASVSELQSSSASQISSNLPLFIMDGFEVSLSIVNDLDDNLVESIMVYKDASATAMYGAKGANGVVVITTVKPAVGKLRFSYTGRLNMEYPDLSSYNMMNAEEKLAYEWAAGLYDYVRADDQQDLLELYNKRLFDVRRGVDTYWMKMPLRVSAGQSHSLRIDGGKEEIRYALNLSYRKTEGTMKGSDRNTLIGGVTLSYELGRLLFQNEMSITYSKGEESPYGEFSDWVAINAYWTPYDDEGNVKKMLEQNQYYESLVNLARTQTTNTVYNPLYNTRLPQLNSKQYTNIRNNFAVDWKILEELRFRGSVGVTAQYDRSDRYISALHTMFENYTGEDLGRKGRYTYGSGNSFNYTVRMTLDYSKLFDEKHLLSAGLSYRVDEDKSESYSFTAEGISNPSMDFLGMASSYLKDGAPSATEGISRNIGLSANVVYDYDNRYFLNLAGTYDGSSKYGVKKRWAPFISFGGGWNVHNEDFAQRFAWLTQLRLKISYGIVGSQNFNTYQALTTFKDYGSQTYSGWSGVYLMAMGNESLKWQTTNKLNLGLEFQLFRGLVAFTGNYYHEITHDMVNDITLPTSGGFNSYKANIGKISNDGIELSGNVYVIRNTASGLIWNVGATLAHNKNTIKKISNTLKYLNEQVLASDGADPSLIYEEGKSLNTLYAVKSLGIDPANGREIFVKKDGKTQTYDWSASDKVDCGQSVAKFDGRVNTRFTFKNLELDAYFSYQFGGQSYNQTLVNKLENIVPYKNADRRAYYDRWQTPGVFARFKDIQDFSTTRASSRFIMDDDRFELKTLSLGYRFDGAWMNRVGLDYLKLSGNMEDVFYISTIKRERGLSYPFSHKFSLSLSARF